ncbi:DctP family TRAP transporter solute-binding subunit [Methylobacterium sp. JK268]
MDRRCFILGAISGLSFGAAARSRAEASPRARVFRLAVTNATPSATGQFATAFASEIAASTGGRLRIETYPSGTLGGEFETTQDAAKGAMDLVITSSAGYANLVPKLGVFDIPFLFRDVGHARAVLDGPIGQKALGEVEPAGLVGLAWGENGLRHLTTTDVPVRSPRDLAGLKIRVPQSEVMIAGFKAFGADPRPLAFPDLYGALSAGEFQGQENPLANIASANFDRVQKYLSLTGHIYSPAMLLMARGLHETLSEEERALFRRAGRKAAQVCRRFSDESETKLLADLKGRGMTVIPDIDRAAFAAAAASAAGPFEAQFGKAVLDAIRA